VNFLPRRHYVKPHNRAGQKIQGYYRGSGTIVTPRTNKVVKKKTDIDIAKEMFGTTKDPNKALFILPDGSFLGKDDPLKPYRIEDHWAIDKIYRGREDEKGHFGPYRFIEDTGSIRMLRESPADDATLTITIPIGKDVPKITRAQWNAISRAKSKRGKICFEFQKRNFNEQGLPMYENVGFKHTEFIPVIETDYMYARASVK